MPVILRLKENQYRTLMHWDAGHNNIIESDRTSLPTPGLSANRQLCKLNGVGLKRKASRRGSGAKNEDKEDGFGCILGGVGARV
jgi:hypothetical protein